MLFLAKIVSIKILGLLTCVKYLVLIDSRQFRCPSVKIVFDLLLGFRLALIERWKIESNFLSFFVFFYFCGGKEAS